MRISRHACVAGWVRVVTKPSMFLSNLLTATDTEIWERGRRDDLVIFSKDVDFYDRALLFDKPPQVVHVAVGNCNNTRLFSALASE